MERVPQALSAPRSERGIFHDTYGQALANIYGLPGDGHPYVRRKHRWARRLSVPRRERLGNVATEEM